MEGAGCGAAYLKLFCWARESHRDLVDGRNESLPIHHECPNSRSRLADRVAFAAGIRLPMEVSGVAMSVIELQSERAGHPVDLVEHLASLNDWAFDRLGEDEISIVVKGHGCDYAV